MIINDGGPAYPVTQWNNDTESYQIMGGMSLRDHFAGLAMQGMYANPGFTLVEDPAITVEDQIAEFAYKQADAMLAELERER